MKLNGKNIITDKDITVTGAKNLGDNLSDILQEQQSSIDSLRSNVKWLYKYGGTGSGGGGGTGSSKDWGIFATLGGRTLIDKGIISLSGDSDIYQLFISIRNGNGNYSVDITYDNGKTDKAVLTPENGWKTVISLNLPKNSFINITVTDGSDVKNIETTYITNPYSFSNIKMVNDTGVEYQNINNDIFISDASENGLNLQIKYDISIDSITTYYWEYLGIITATEIIEDNSGVLSIKFPPEYLINDKAGLYEVKCHITITPTNQDPEIIDKSINFNLIPETLFLKVAPEVGSFYSEIQNEIDKVYSYKTSTSIGLIVRAYCGVNQNRVGSVKTTTYNVDELHNITQTGETKEYPIVENINTPIQIYYLTPGWKKVVLICTLGGESYTTEKYLYLKETATSYDWYKKSAEPSLTTYYRPGGTSNSEMNKIFGNNLYYQMYNSSDSLILDHNIVDTPTSGNIGDILISIGIQYNEINNSNDPIASFNYTSSGQLLPFCTIYQNKINIENNDIPIFLGKTDITKFDPTKPENYHLVQISLKHTFRDISGTVTGNSGDYRQICVYIDGTLEGAANNWINYTREISQITLYPSNYSINLLEVANFSGYLSRQINDVDINYYYNTYKIKSRSDETVVSDEETAIINNLYSYDSENNATLAYSIENQLIKLSSSASISQISSCVKVPTLVCKVERFLRSYDNTGKTVFDWLNTPYDNEQDSDQAVEVGLQGFRCPVSVRWYNNPKGGGSGISFDNSKLISGKSLFNSENIEFYLRLQGSSTMRYKSKNLTLGVRKTSEEADSSVPIFSPNFKKNDSSTFLPDSAFTLKADVVDSSHSNNTSLGKFVNDIYTVAGINGASPVGELRGHVKACLEGFPILMFLEVTDESSGTAALDTEYYYLGIYNFNLGRENQLNLGYVDLNVLYNNESELLEPDEYSFTGISIPSSEYRPVDNLVVAEVQGNSPVWDFSQYHNSVLFKIDSITGDTNFMFGDIVYGPQQQTTYKSNIAKFVKSVSGAGNYIFNELGKEFKDIVDPNTGETISHVAYRTVNTVPNADSQYTRRSDGKTFDKIDRLTSSDDLNPSRSDINFGINLLKSCILETESGDNTISPYLDYKSAIYYYTICMAFGLVDSVQKNLNIKTWNGKTFGLYFYDMDTALGTSNSGGDTSYFCFSDYWKTAITKLLDEEGNEVLDESGNPVYKNSGAEIFRDHYPDDKGLPSGYDIPSTYLFSISKYASCFSKNLSGQDTTVNLDFPQNIWGRWRSQGNTGELGILENSDKFIEKYFSGHLKDIPEVLLNLNYRVKYLYVTKGNSFNDTDSGNLKGRQIEKVRDWLSSRFHILDAYFNLNKDSVLINTNKSTGVSVYEPICSVDSLNKNIDIQVLHDIFSPTDNEGNITTLNREGLLNFRVKARNYTPLIHRHANTLERFLLEDENTEYEINVVYNGNQTSKFGGSEGWTYLDSLNSFIQTLKIDNAFSLSTKRLEYISGTKGKLTGEAKLNIPAAKSLILTSPEYSCKVNINNSFYNLTNINISNSKIQLNVEGSKLNNIVANNINSEKLSLLSCSNLKTISLTGSTIKEFSASPIWLDASDYLDLSSLKVTILNLQGRGGELVINNSTNLTNLTFTGFKKISITSCPNLTNITCNDSDAVLEDASITGCGNVKKVTLIADNLKYLNLNQCINLKDLELRKLDAVVENDLILPNLIKLQLMETSISRIKRPIKVSNNWVEPDSRKSNNILYLTDYPNLNTKEFSIKSNKVVEYIKVQNDKNNPFKLYNPLSYCENLKRVYGNIEINTSDSFNSCSLFSIHGYYDGTNEIDGSDDTLLTLGTEEQTIKYNGISVIDSDGRVKHPLEMGDNVVESLNDGTGKCRMVFQEGDLVTNICFNTTITNTLSSAFYKTSCSIFDIYYIFQDLETASSSVNADSCFWNGGILGTSTRFTWNDKVDNSPNRLMFRDWGDKISSLQSTFRERGKDLFRIFTTYESDDVTVYGLFSYLTNITSLNSIFLGIYYTDNNVFTSTTGEFSDLKTISYFSPRDFIDGINTLNYSDIFDSNGNYSSKFLLNQLQGDFKLGNVSGLFKQCTGLKNLTNVLNTTRFINYETADLNIPKELNSIVYSFFTDYALGELKFSDMFLDGVCNISEISQSFYVKSSFEEWIVGLLGSNMTDYTDSWIELHNELFNRFPNLSIIGFRPANLDANGTILTSNYSSFGGKLKKVCKNNEFPYEIVKNLSNLKVFTGFFRNLDFEDYNTTLELPGEMFINNTKLENISRCFQDIKAVVNLTPRGFVNCSNLIDVSYLFCNSYVGSVENLYRDGKNIGIVSSIPSEFFYHGENPKLESITIKGSNELITKIVENQDGWVINEGGFSAEYINPDSTEIIKYSGIKEFIKSGEGYITGFILSPISNITVEKYSEGKLVSTITEQIGNYENIEVLSDSVDNIRVIYSTIRYMQNCFQGQGWITPYDIGDDTEYVLETNPSYQPYNYLYNTSGKWIDCSNTREDNKETYMWTYDGKHLNNTGHYIDENIDRNNIGNIVPPRNTDEGEVIQCSTNFFCPPDLFRYCTPDVNIINIFNYTGYSAQLYLKAGSRSSGNITTDTEFGITGRICPYLLKPIPSVTSLEGFITFASRLSYYITEETSEESGKIYLIPETFFTYATKVYNLNSAFKGLNFPYGCKLNVFDKLTSPLNLNYTFQYPYFHSGESGEKFNLSGVFIKNNVSSAVATFSIENCPESLPELPGRITNQYIEFGENFTKSRMPSETSSSNYKVKHVYDGYSGNTVIFAGYNSDSDTSTEFRVHNTRNTTPYNYRVREQL